MNPSGMFKILLALAPVLAIIFYLISLKQEHQDTRIEKFNSGFDENFNKMAGEMEFDSGDREFWDDKSKKASARMAEFEKMDEENSAKSKAVIDDMEKAIKDTNLEEIK
jgi:hypothetical protein